MKYNGKELEPQPKPKRATYLQLAEWLAKGNGMFKEDISAIYSYTSFSLDTDEENREIRECEIVIRPFGTTKWLEPTLENMGIKEK